MKHHPFSQIQNLRFNKINYYVLISISLFLILIMGGGHPAELQAAEITATCYQTFLPAVLGNGGGAGAPVQSSPLSMGACGLGSEEMADFNGDGYADLAIAVPNESVMFNGIDVLGAGAVHVIYGTAEGLTANNSQFWTRASSGIAGDPDDYDLFGSALTVADFNSDGYDDLAIGASNANSPAQDNSGVVHVLFGSANGLTASGSRLFVQGMNGLSDSPEILDRFGDSLDSGDYDGDGYDDLAIGVVEEDLQGKLDAGAVHIVFGSSSGFRTGDQFIHQGVLGSTNLIEAGDSFGFEMASGDYNNDNYEDLAVGIPDEDILGPGGNLDQAGAVQIFYGNPDGLIDEGTNSVNAELWHADSNNYVLGDLDANDRFGYSLEAADFDGDGYVDLAVGIPWDDLGPGGGTVSAAGAINIFYGSFFGIDATATKMAVLFHQNTFFMLDEAEPADLFGQGLEAADFNGDGFVDLAIGIPFEHNALNVGAGAVSIMFSSEDGLTPVGNQLTFNSVILAEESDRFGQNLTAGDYDGDGFADLAIGSQNGTAPSGVRGGIVAVRYGEVGGIPGPVGQDYWHQDSPGIQDVVEESDLFGSALP